MLLEFSHIRLDPLLPEALKKRKRRLSSKAVIPPALQNSKSSKSLGRSWHGATGTDDHGNTDGCLGGSDHALWWWHQ